MAQLIYRGTVHTKTTAPTQSSTAQDLIYRGVAHDGLSSATIRRNDMLCYRGIAYTKDNAGRIFVETGLSSAPAGLSVMVS